MTLSINGKTYEAGELVAYVKKLEKENLYYKDTIETNTAEWEEQGQRVVELEKENAELKDGIALKDEEVGCIETDFNTFKSKAKEIIKNLLILKNDHFGNTKMEWRVKVTEQAEQFLNSEEK